METWNTIYLKYFFYFISFRFSFVFVFVHFCLADQYSNRVYFKYICFMVRDLLVLNLESWFNVRVPRNHLPLIQPAKIMLVHPKYKIILVLWNEYFFSPPDISLTFSLLLLIFFALFLAIVLCFSSWLVLSLWLSLFKLSRFAIARKGCTFFAFRCDSNRFYIPFYYLF